MVGVINAFGLCQRHAVLGFVRGTPPHTGEVTGGDL